MQTRLGQDRVCLSNDVESLGVAIDNNLRLEKHVSNICLKVSRKLSALSNAAKFAPFKKRRILFKAFIESQFKYCTLVWMFHETYINDKINKLHEKTLRIIYNDAVMSFKYLLIEKKSLKIHHQIFNHYRSKYIKLHIICRQQILTSFLLEVTITTTFSLNQNCYCQMSILLFFKDKILFAFWIGNLKSHSY